MQKNESMMIILSGGIIGIIASCLVYFGNPMNMGFCIACFLRDTAGGLGLHSTATVQYIRPEIIGLILGSFIIAVAKNEFNAKGGSSPLTRFILAFFVMIGDLNAIFGLVGFIAGIMAGVYFLNKGYSLKRTYKLPKLEGSILPIIAVVLLVFLLIAPVFIHFTESASAPGGKHAALAISLVAGIIVGMLAQRTRLCMVGGIRDIILFGQSRLLLGFVAILMSAFICNLILTNITDVSYFNLGFDKQPIAHTDGIWNFLGMLLAGFGCVLLGGCPLRQLVLAGEGNSDSAITVLGLIIGAAFAHNFGLASSGNGPTVNGQIAVVIGLVVTIFIAYFNTFSIKSK